MTSGGNELGQRTGHRDLATDPPITSCCWSRCAEAWTNVLLRAPGWRSGQPHCRDRGRGRGGCRPAAARGRRRCRCGGRRAASRAERRRDLYQENVHRPPHRHRSVRHQPRQGRPRSRGMIRRSRSPLWDSLVHYLGPDTPVKNPPRARPGRPTTAARSSAPARGPSILPTASSAPPTVTSTRRRPRTSAAGSRAGSTRSPAATSAPSSTPTGCSTASVTDHEANGIQDGFHNQPSPTCSRCHRD